MSYTVHSYTLQQAYLEEASDATAPCEDLIKISKYHEVMVTRGYAIFSGVGGGCEITAVGTLALGCLMLV